MIDLTLAGHPLAVTHCDSDSYPAYLVANWVRGELYLLEALIAGRIKGWPDVKFHDMVAFKPSWRAAVAERFPA